MKLPLSRKKDRRLVHPLPTGSIRRLATCASGALLLLLGCSDGKSKKSDGPTVDIAIVLDASDQEEVRRRLAMMRLAASEINEAGGITLDGEQRRVVSTAATYDNTKQGRELALEDMVDRGLSFGVGPNSSSAVLGEEDDHSDGFAYGARDREIILISPSATSSQISDLDDDGHMWRTAPPDDLQARVAAAHLLEDRGVSTLAVMYRDDTYGEGLAQAVTQAFEAGGGEVVATIAYPQSPPTPTYDFEDELAEALADKPDALYTVSGEELTQIANNLVLQGYWAEYDQEPLVVFGADVSVTFSLLSNTVPEVLTTLSGTTPASDVDSRDYHAMEEALATIDIEPLALDAYRYDAFYVVAYAIQKARSLDAEVVKEEITNVTSHGDGDAEIHVGDWRMAVEAMSEGRDIDYEGASGPIELQPNGDPGGALYSIWQVAEESDGTFDFDFTELRGADE